MFLSGLAFGSAPWCKLQALPIAGVLSLAVLAAPLNGEQRPQRRIRHVATFFAGALLPACVILGAVVHSRVTRDFWISYVLGNFAHAGRKTVPAILADCASVLFSAQMLPLSLMDLLAAAFFVQRIRHRGGGRFPERELWILGGVLLYTGAAVFSVCRPPTNFAHYQIFLLQPMTYLAAVWVNGDLSFRGSQSARIGLASGFAVAVACAIVVALGATGLRYAHYVTAVIQETARHRQDSNERIAAVVREIDRSHPVRTLAIWGWAPGVYVLSGIPPATRDADMSVVITKGPLQGYYRQRFFDDLRRKMPDLFIDAVAQGTYMWNPGYNDWTENDGYESYGEVRRFVDANYALVGELRLRPGAKPVRFFARTRSRRGSSNSE